MCVHCTYLFEQLQLAAATSSAADRLVVVQFAFSQPKMMLLVSHHREHFTAANASATQPGAEVVSSELVNLENVPYIVAATVAVDEQTSQVVVLFRGFLHTCL